MCELSFHAQTCNGDQPFSSCTCVVRRRGGRRSDINSDPVFGAGRGQGEGGGGAGHLAHRTPKSR
jgi:hypothetical protein